MHLGLMTTSARRLPRRAHLPLAGLLALLATLGICATVATTTASAGTCSAGRVCMWEDPNFSGSRYVNVLPSVNRYYEIDWWNGDNEISSVVNNSYYAVKLSDGDYTDGPSWNRNKGTAVCIPPYGRVPDLIVYPFGNLTFDNRAESFYMSYSC